MLYSAGRSLLHQLDKPEVIVVRFKASRKPLKPYRYKASWRGTALTFWVEAKDEADAEKKAMRLVTRMEGGASCMELKLVEGPDAQT